MIRKTVGRIMGAAATALLERLTRRPLPRSVTEWRYVDCSCAQFGEDILVFRALEALRKSEVGYYVDIGAFDPIVYSNTIRLHWLGWRGINVDAQPKHVANFNRLRPDDVNLHLAVSENPGLGKFLCYDAGTTGRLAGADPDAAKSLLGEEVREVIEVPTQTLAAILAKYAPADRPFGFLTVDCEGSDLEVLRSNDWARFKPWIIAVEDHSNCQATDIDRFCRDRGYQLFAMAHVTKIFVQS